VQVKFDLQFVENHGQDPAHDITFKNDRKLRTKVCITVTYSLEDVYFYALDECPH
jgi:hypothetical protein